MPKLLLKALDCDETEDLSELAYSGDDCRLELFIDSNENPITLRQKIESRRRWIINKAYSFNSIVKIQLWDEDSPDPDDLLGINFVLPHLTHRSSTTFKWDGANYILWYEVVGTDETEETAHKISQYSLKDFLGRLGKGVLSDDQYQELVTSESIYKCSEVFSLLDTFRLHAQQDRQKGNTKSIKKWIDLHCNPWGEKSVIPIADTPEGNQYLESGLEGDQWKVVHNEKSYCMAGLQKLSRKTNTDYYFNHETMDWNWYQILDPSFIYMLDYTAKQHELSDNTEYPMTENEWETGSFPIQWRPFPGEYVTQWGRHLFDLGHVPIKIEMHPAHTIIREHTTADYLGSNGELVPVNRVIIGMGLSGGFPGNVGSRWKDETGENPPNGISGDTTNCWATNLKKHPLKFKIFHPVPKPSENSILKSKIVLCEYIQVKDWKKVDEFLELCQYDDPAEREEELGFRVWNSSAGLPAGFRPNEAPASLKPKFILRHDSYFEVEINLSPATQIPVGYYAIIECGWSERGNHKIYEFDVTFEKINAVETDEGWDDWHLYYGVNGQWAAWWTDDFIEEGESYEKNTHFKAWTVDEMPLLIRDCGIEWDGYDDGSEYMDRVEITALGPDHFNNILDHKGVELISRTRDTLKFKAKGWEMVPESTKHEWIIRIERKEL